MSRVLALVPDLLFGSKVQAMLETAGHDVEMAQSETDVWDQIAGTDVLVVDLTTDDVDPIGLLDTLRTLEGQATELGWRRDRVDELEPEDYLDLIMHKTCWYTTVHPLRAARLLPEPRGSDAPASPIRPSSTASTIQIQKHQPGGHDHARGGRRRLAAVRPPREQPLAQRGGLAPVEAVDSEADSHPDDES